MGSKGKQNMPSPKYASLTHWLFRAGYFLKTDKQEKHLKWNTSYPFVRGVYVYKGNHF